MQRQPTVPESHHRLPGAAAAGPRPGAATRTRRRPPAAHLLATPPAASTGHKGKFGHEFMEFEIQPNGKLRYANDSGYKSERRDMIRKEVTITPAIIDELKRIINESEVTQEDDNQWPEPVRGVLRARRVARRGGA